MKELAPEVEREVRRLAAKGYKLREIARILGEECALGGSRTPNLLIRRCR
jgi:hypothetical protein